MGALGSIVGSIVTTASCATFENNRLQALLNFTSINFILQ
jgi:hypothetical protein